VNATKAAIEEGIVAGGGVALFRASEMVREKFGKKKDSSDETKIGYDIVLDAATVPLKQIVYNTGVDVETIVGQVKKLGKNGGYDALANELIPDMIAAGIIDPVKVTRNALQNAVSAAAILLTTEVAVTEEPKEEKADMAGGMPGGMNGMGY
jgi:chaperonin GroEL